MLWEKSGFGLYWGFLMFIFPPSILDTCTKFCYLVLEVNLANLYNLNSSSMIFWNMW